MRRAYGKIRYMAPNLIPCGELSRFKVMLPRHKYPCLISCNRPQHSRKENHIYSTMRHARIVEWTPKGEIIHGSSRIF